MINRAFQILSQNRLLVLVPCLFDLASFIVGWLLFGFGGGSKLTFKFSLHVGLPSISAVLDRPVMANSLHFDLSGFTGSLLSVFLMIIVFVLTAYLQGGFIGLLHESAQRHPVSLQLFQQKASRFFLRFLLIQVALFAGTILLGGLLFVTLGGFGAICFLLLFLILRVLYIFFEFTLVADDLTPLDALARARGYFRQRAAETSSIIGAMIGLNFIASLIINLLWHPVFFLVMIVVYSILATGLQLALMLALHETRRRTWFSHE